MMASAMISAAASSARYAASLKYRGDHPTGFGQAPATTTCTPGKMANELCELPSASAIHAAAARGMKR